MAVKAVCRAVMSFVPSGAFQGAMGAWIIANMVVKFASSVMPDFVPRDSPGSATGKVAFRSVYRLLMAQFKEL